MNRLKFISYDGKDPILCSGQLIVELDGNEIKFESDVLDSGGLVRFDEDRCEIVESGPRTINKNYIPDEIPDELIDELLILINENIPRGCCGGCV